MRRPCVLACLAMLFAEVVCAMPQADSLIVQANVPVTPITGGLSMWSEIKADPEDPRRLIVCGTTRDAETNAFHGIVYSSRDGGQSWKIALQDRNSTHVTEHSCAFGKRHLAYFVSEAAKVVDGMVDMDHGTSRIFFSSDGGETWAETAKTGWADFSTSVVVANPNGSGQQLYVFYNGEPIDNVKHVGSAIEFFAVSEDGTVISPRQAVASMRSKSYGAAYPSSSVVLNNGEILALYEAPTGTHGDVNVFDLGVARINPKGGTNAVTIATHSGTRGCHVSLSNSLAYDKEHDRLYAAYNDATSGTCALLLSRSDDGGQSWSVPYQVQPPPNSVMYFPVLAARPDGVIGLLSKGKADGSPGCWNFSVLKDGAHLDDTVSLSPCVEENSLKDQSSALLRIVILHLKADDDVSVDVMTQRDALFRVGMTVTSDGAFHPVWTTLGNVAGELRSASVRLSDNSSLPGQATLAPTELEDVTSKLTVLYGGNQRLDRDTNSILLDIVLRNDSAASIRAPLYLKLEKLDSDFGQVELERSSESAGVGPGYFDLSSCLDKSELAAGRTSSACHLRVHFSSENPPERNRWFLSRMKFRLFAVKPS